MNCRSARGHLPLYVGGELTGSRAEEVREHLNGCPRCAEELEVFETCRTSLDAMGDVESPDPDRLWSTIRSEIPALRGRRTRTLSILRYAAIVLVGLSLGFTTMTLGSEVAEPEPPAEADMSFDEDPQYLVPGNLDRPIEGNVRRAADGEPPKPSTNRRRVSISTSSNRKLEAEIRKLRIENGELRIRLQQLEEKVGD